MISFVRNVPALLRMPPAIYSRLPLLLCHRDVRSTQTFDLANVGVFLPTSHNPPCSGSTVWSSARCGMHHGLAKRSSLPMVLLTLDRIMSIKDTSQGPPLRWSSLSPWSAKPELTTPITYEASYLLCTHFTTAFSSRTASVL